MSPLRSGLAAAALVLVADQLSKLWVVRTLHLQDIGSIPLTRFASLTWVANRGVSMGLLTASGEAGRWLLVALTAAIALGVTLALRREKRRLDALALGMVLGGALGNIADRIRLGYVVDFVHVYWRDLHFYVFNVADAAISTGVVLLLARSLLSPSANRAKGRT